MTEQSGTSWEFPFLRWAPMGTCTPWRGLITPLGAPLLPGSWWEINHLVWVTRGVTCHQGCDVIDACHPPGLPLLPSVELASGEGLVPLGGLETSLGWPHAQCPPVPSQAPGLGLRSQPSACTASSFLIKPSWSPLMGNGFD